MPQNLTIALAQINPIVGDLSGNAEKIFDYYQRAVQQNADLVIFPELAITGYPPEDLVLREGFCQRAMEAIELLAQKITDNTAVLLGGIWKENGALYNTAFLLQNGAIKQKRYKRHLPNYGVFDEARLFEAGEAQLPMEFAGRKISVLICEDMWRAENFSQEDVDLAIVINASPFEMDKCVLRLEYAKKICKTLAVPLIYVNQVGGQDELVFDGASFILDEKGQRQASANRWSEDFLLTSWNDEKNISLYSEGGVTKPLNRLEEIYHALVLGLTDYINKNGFPGILIGLSGGIDSALSAAIAVDALGKERVRLVMMPSRYTSEESLEDAKSCSDMLGVALETIPIDEIVMAYTRALSSSFSGQPVDVTEENIQSRIRGGILMALSNKFGHMVLSTGNKSEMAVGYATLYGDMCGGFNVLKDIYKTTVFALARWRNEQGNVMPERILTKAPSAELALNQKDEDSLPPYERLDKILALFIEQRMPVDTIIAQGFEAEEVEKVIRLAKNTEYKRKQAPPGVKITSLAFGRDRRYPITNKYQF